MQEELFKNIIAHAKEYGFIFQSSEIYDGLSAVYDYGPNGTELKNNIKNYWWDAMVKAHDNIVGLDTAIFMHPKVWEASGHVAAFNDPLIDNKDSKKRYRADVLLEEYIAKLEERIEKEVRKGQKRFKEALTRPSSAPPTPTCCGSRKIDRVKDRMVAALNTDNLQELRQLILDCEIVCPISGTRNWTDVRQFNLMFSTQMGSTNEGTGQVFLRPETAQGIFVNFLNVQKSSRMKIPFGIAQTGKAFRNEIVARQFIFRMREFEQMEMQYFVRPGKEMEWYEYWKQARMDWHQSLGLGAVMYRFKDHEKLAHYANAACDIEFQFPLGSKSWKASIPVRITTWPAMKSSRAVKCATLIRKLTRLRAIRSGNLHRVGPYVFGRACRRLQRGSTPGRRNPHRPEPASVPGSHRPGCISAD